MLELRSVRPEDQVRRFFYYWTLKESYIKAVGAGLSIPLDRLSFAVTDAGRIGLTFHEGLLDDPQRWSHWLLEPTSEHLVAICAERISRQPRRIVARQVVPLVSYEPFDCRVIAQ